MLRRVTLAVLALVLAGCDEPPSKGEENIIHMDMPRANTNAAPMALYAPPPAFVPPPDIVIQTRSPNALFSVQHNLTLMMPHDAVAARFQAARDACLKDKRLSCLLTSASIAVSGTVSAQLQVALPHEKVALFEQRLTKRLPQDGSGKVEFTSRSTSAENQTAAVADIDRQLAQAKSYRDSLEQLGKRPNLTVDEVIKIHTELTEAQNAVDVAEAAKRASTSDIVLERMTISLEETPAPPVARSTFDQFWTNAHDVLMASLADMLLRLVNLLPWLPVALVIAWLVSRFVGRVRIRRGQ